MEQTSCMTRLQKYLPLGRKSLVPMGRKASDQGPRARLGATWLTNVYLNLPRVESVLSMSELEAVPCALNLDIPVESNPQ